VVCARRPDSGGRGGEDVKTEPDIAWSVLGGPDSGGRGREDVKTETDIAWSVLGGPDSGGRGREDVKTEPDIAWSVLGGPDSGGRGREDVKTEPERDIYAREMAAQIRVTMETYLTNPPIIITTCSISVSTVITVQ
jgi:hypothetical protein